MLVVNFKHLLGFSQFYPDLNNQGIDIDPGIAGRNHMLSYAINCMNERRLLTGIIYVCYDSDAKYIQINACLAQLAEI